MGLVGLFPIVIAVVVIVPTLFFVVRLFKNLDGGQKDVAQLMQTGAAAQGRIVSVQMGTMSITTGAHRHLQLTLAIDIYPHPQGAPQRIQLTQVVSELQIAQLQPGAHVEVRYDPANPQRAVVSGIAGYGGMQPMHVMQMPGGARVGLMIGILGGVVGVVVAIVVGIQSMSLGGFSSAASDDDAASADDDRKSKKKSKKSASKDDDEICVKATRCCKAVLPASGQSSCDQWEEKAFVPACEAALDGYVKTAKATGKSCD